MEELLVAVNPEPDSRLRYLLWLPLAGGMVFRTSGTWCRGRLALCVTGSPARRGRFVLRMMGFAPGSRQSPAAPSTASA